MCADTIAVTSELGEKIDMATLQALHTSPGHATDEPYAVCGWTLQNLPHHQDAAEAFLPMVRDPAVVNVLPANDYRAAVLSEK